MNMHTLTTPSGECKLLLANVVRQAVEDLILFTPIHMDGTRAKRSSTPRTDESRKAAAKRSLRALAHQEANDAAWWMFGPRPLKHYCSFQSCCSVLNLSETAIAESVIRMMTPEQRKALLPAMNDSYRQFAEWLRDSPPQRTTRMSNLVARRQTFVEQGVGAV